jgi:hypothetical protein
MRRLAIGGVTRMGVFHGRGSQPARQARTAAVLRPLDGDVSFFALARLAAHPVRRC